LLMDCAIVDNVRVPAYSLDSQPLPLLALAKHYGVDVKAVRAQASGAAKDVATGDLLQAGGCGQTADEGDQLEHES
jgi:hypothetical protein